MLKPKSFVGLFGVFNQSMVVAAIMYAGIGFFGYMRYGSAVEGSITLNLPDGDG